MKFGITTGLLKLHGSMTPEASAADKDKISTETNTGLEQALAAEGMADELGSHSANIEEGPGKAR